MAAKCKRSIPFAFDPRCTPEATERRLAARWVRRWSVAGIVLTSYTGCKVRRMQNDNLSRHGRLKSRRGDAFHPRLQSYWLSGRARSASGR